MSAGAAFDAVAATYDAVWTNSPVGRAQRDQVWRQIDPLFGAGDRVLDIGCGTGEDAAHLAARGLLVHAIDASPAMVVEAARRGGFTTAVARAEDVAGLGRFDGVISNFGALNCVDDLAAVARRLASAVRPGGRASICVIGRFCAWETLYYAARLQFRKAQRRYAGHALRAFPEAGQAQSACSTAVYYPSVDRLCAAFAPDFYCERWSGVGLLVPPSYVRLPAPLVRAFAALDRVLAGIPLLRGLADHRLIILVRR